MGRECLLYVVHCLAVRIGLCSQDSACPSSILLIANFSEHFPDFLISRNRLHESLLRETLISSIDRVPKGATFNFVVKGKFCVWSSRGHAGPWTRAFPREPRDRGWWDGLRVTRGARDWRWLTCPSQIRRRLFWGGWLMCVPVVEGADSRTAQRCFSPTYWPARGRGCGWRARVVRGPGKLPWSPRLLSRHVRGGATLGGMMTVSGGWWCLLTSPMTFSSSGAVWFFVLIWGRPRPRPPPNPLPQWSLEISNPSIIYYMPRSCCSNKLNLFKLLGRRVDLDLLYYPYPTVQEGQTDGDVNTPSNSRHQTQVIIGSTIRVPLTKFSSD